MRRSLVFLFLLLLLLLPATAARAVERFELDNGLTVIVKPQRGAPVVAVGAYLRTGRIYEPPRLAGISHFIEHMMFRATGKRPGGKSEREAWSAGARYRAYTHEDYTHYQIVLPSERMDLALDLLSDSLTSAAFRSEEVEEERTVILEEIAKREGDPELWAFEELMGMAFLPHPYGGRIIGERETVGRITRDELYAWYHARYAPERTTLVAVGDVTPSDFLERARRFFGAWPRSGAESTRPPPPTDGFGHYQESIVRRDGASPMLLLSVGMPTYLHSDYMAARFFRETLSGWIRDRLVLKERVAHSTDVYFTTLVGRNMLRMRVLLSAPEKAAAARDAVLSLLREMNRGAWRYGGIESVAANFRARELLVKEDLDQYAQVIGRAAMRGFYSPDGVPAQLVADDRYSRIGAADLERIARRYLVPANMRVLFLMPPDAKTEIPPPDLGSAAKEKGRFSPVGDVRRVPAESETNAGDPPPPPKDSDATLRRIPGGARYLLLERNSVPLVGGAIVFPVGSRLDPAGKEGLAALTLESLEFATKGREKYEVRWLMYENGSSLRVRANRDTCLVAFTVPRDALPDVLEAVRDILARPAFTDEAIRTARGRVLRRVRSAEESVARSTGAAFRSVVYGGTPEAHEPDGTEETLTRIRREDLVEFHAKHLRREDAVIALVGDLSPRSTSQLVARLFAPGAAAPAPTEDPRPAVPPPATARHELHHPSGRGYVLVGTRGPALHDPDKVATELVRKALGWKVFAEFTDVRSTAYEAGAIFSSLESMGAFGLYVGTAPRNLAETEAALLSFLAEAAKEGIPDELREDAKGAWLGSAALGSLRSASVASRIATREATDRGYGSFDEDAAELRALTAKRLKAVASRLFGPGRFVTVVANPPR